MSEYMFEAEVAAEKRIPAGTLRYYRHRGIGPRYFKRGRRVVYKRADVDAWLEAQYAATNGPVA